MDPIANVVEQQALARAIIRREATVMDPDAVVTQLGNAARLAVLVGTLHDWRTGGGFDPYATSKLGHPCDFCGRRINYIQPRARAADPPNEGRE